MIKWSINISLLLGERPFLERFRLPQQRDLAQWSFTYLPTWTGTLYLAVVIDVWSRRVAQCELGGYNPHRWHSVLAYQSPIQYERAYAVAV